MRKRTRLKDLSEHDKAEVQKFKKFLKVNARLGSQKDAYAEVYGEQVFPKKELGR